LSSLSIGPVLNLARPNSRMDGYFGSKIGQRKGGADHRSGAGYSLEVLNARAESWVIGGDGRVDAAMPTAHANDFTDDLAGFSDLTAEFGGSGDSLPDRGTMVLDPSVRHESGWRLLVLGGLEPVLQAEKPFFE
jgi:hypothetical protein